MAKIYYRSPKNKTFRGKKYQIFGVEGVAKPRAIATFFVGPKYGWKEVRNLSIRAAILKGLPIPNKKGYSTGKKFK